MTAAHPDRLARRRASLCLAVLLLVVTPALAQTSTATGHDSSLPIEVTADSLEVQRDKSIAIFRGDVLAVQGEMNLSAETLVVHYTESDGTDEGTTISRIDAQGNVFVSSPNQTAHGDVGVYDVEQGIIDLSGADVVLTRDQNVIHGNHLVMNLETGYSRVESAAGTTGEGERVKSIFVPEATE